MSSKPGFESAVLLIAVAVSTVLLGYISATISLNSYNSWISYRNPYIDSILELNPERLKIPNGYESAYRNIIFILYDGVNTNILLDLAGKHEPIKRLLSMGALYINGLTNMPSYSLPGRASILTGSPPEINEVSSNEFSGEIRVDSLVKIAKENGLKILCSGDSSIARMFSSLIDSCIEIPDGAGHGSNALARGIDLLRSTVGNGEKAFLWIGISDTDLMGHSSGGGSEEYNNTIVNIVEQTLSFIEELESIDMARDTLIVIVNDHGFKRGGHHGGPEYEVRRVFALFIGSNTVPGVYSESFMQHDIAPTVSMLMGWRLPTHSMGRVLQSGFDVPESLKEAYSEASREQARSVIASIDRFGLQLGSDPWAAYREIAGRLYSDGYMYRSIYVVLPLALTILIALYLATQSSGASQKLKALLLELATAVAVFEGSYWIIYSLIGGPYSLSDLKSFNEFITKILAATLVSSLVAGACLGLINTANPTNRPLKTAIKALLIASAALSLQLYYTAPLYIAYGPVVRFPFPDWSDAFMFFLSLTRGAYIAFIGLPVLAITASAIHILGRSLLRLRSAYICLDKQGSGHG